MKWIRFLFLTTLLLQAAFLKSPACSCQELAKLHESLQYSDLVCSGTVLSISYTYNYDSLCLEQAEPSRRQWPVFPLSIVCIKINTCYKGCAATDTMRLLTPRSGAACGFHFEEGNQYIVYCSLAEPIIGVYRFRKDIPQQMFWVHQCSRTEHWSADEDSAIRAWLKK